MKEYRIWIYLVSALILLMIPALFDLHPQIADVGTNTISSLSNVLSLAVTVLLVDRFAKLRQERREQVQFRQLRTIAYRSLSQTVNDAGRRIIAPLIGVDLVTAGIPDVTNEEVEKFQSEIARADLEALEMKVGFWNSVESEELLRRFKILAMSHEWTSSMFVFTSRARRELQKGIAGWAPIMILDPDASLKLRDGWQLLDELVMLAETLRAMTSRDNAGPVSLETNRAGQHLIRVVELYRKWLANLQDSAKLPSKGILISDKDWQ